VSNANVKKLAECMNKLDYLPLCGEQN